MTALQATSFTIALLILAVPGWQRLTRTLRATRRNPPDPPAGDVGWVKPPAPGKRPHVTAVQPRAATPGAGHHQGRNMVIDTWECGCIYTWTRQSGWRHDYDCAPDLSDAAIERFINDAAD